MNSGVLSILGTRIDVVDYQGAIEKILGLAEKKEPSSVAAANTHLIAEARRSLDFKKTLQQFDLIVPDGMPLVWSIRARGIKISDRVYGPYLMREVIKVTPRPWKHFFFGGTEKILFDLTSAMKSLQPDLQIVGTFSPPFRNWTEDDEEKFASLINEANPDFIWVALGGVRQEKWIIQNRSRFKRGVFIAVGDAFPLLAGHRSFAPLWAQRFGLTWAYRLIQQPSRVGFRYLKYNTFFLYYTLHDAVLGSPR